jgi:hypothetical protein
MYLHKRKKTEQLLTTYVASALIYLICQELLFIFVAYCSNKITINTFNIKNNYYYYPAISTILILATYLIFKRIYHPKHEHFLLHFSEWLILFVPQMIPIFLYGLNILYVAWLFILTFSTAGCVAFQDLVLTDINNINPKYRLLIYKEILFYLDKLTLAWLTLGTVTAVCMTILWTTQKMFLNMIYQEKVVWSIYMVFCFIIITTLVAIYAAYPMFIEVRKIKTFMYKKNTVQKS